MFFLRNLVYCGDRQDHLNELSKRIQDDIRRLKEEFGTQMMSYPNIYCQLKGNRYSVSFPVDKRRGTLSSVLSQLDRGFPDTRLAHKENTSVSGVQCLRYDFTDTHGDFTITLVGPTNNYFYTFEYTKAAELNGDVQRILTLYEEANKPMHPQVSGQRNKTHQREPTLQGDPIANLEALGAQVFLGAEGDLDWDYLAGTEEAKREIEDTILLTLERPDIFDQITHITRIKFEKNRPRAVLFEGPPGTGKTTSAKIIAHQVKIPMVYVRLETVVSMYYGEAEKNLGKIFQNCNRLGKCLVFIDEIDSLAQSRDREMHEATRRLLSVFLRYMDGFESSEEVILICATNRKQDLDRALQNRFSKVIQFPYPDKHSRAAIFARYARHLPKSHLEELATASSGLTGRDIKSICEDAERQWASKVLRGELLDYSVSPLYYTEALQSRLSQYSS